MKKKMISVLAGFSTMFIAATANAEVIYQQVVSGTYGQVSGYSAGEFAGVNVSVNGTDSARLVTYSYSYADGYKFWYGDIPASAVTVRGVNNIAVQIDTCSVDASAGCGYVDVSINMDPKDGGFITDGSLHYTWDNVIVQVAGPTQVHRADAVGYVNGVSVEGINAYIGKYTTASIMIETGN